MTSIAQTLFTVPPFPGAKRPSLFRHRPQTQDVDPVMAKALIDAIRQEKVGGAYWGQNDPWQTFDSAQPLTFSADDPLALLAAIADCPIRCEARGIFTDLSNLSPGSADHAQITRLLVSHHLLAGIEWLDPFTGQPTSPLEVVAQMGEWRRLIESNRRIGAAFGFAAWKQDTVAALLWAGESSPTFSSVSRTRLDSLKADSAIAIWKARVPAAFLTEVEQSGRPVLEVEDGFIRSIGLGADCVPPLSIVVDDLGAHYDPSRPCRLELLLSEGKPDVTALARAQRLRQAIAASGISKYGVGGKALTRPAGAHHHVLVVGQVEDDRSVLLGGCGIASNLELLRRARTRCPDAFLIYRPHPDVEAGHRKGHIPPAEALAIADQIDPGNAISNLIAMVDEVHVLTSLAGFEALLHGKSVVTHGVPFYAGWGLTTDLCPVPARRGRPRTLDQLAAAVLIDYPRYIDPVSGLPCNVELLIQRMGAGIRRENAALVALRKGLGQFNRLLARVCDRI